MAASIFSPESPWASLPLDLRELVLAHLSRSELLRLCSVSRWWLSLLTSQRFHRLHRSLHRRAHPSLLVYNHAVKISACNWSSGDGSGWESLSAGQSSLSASWHDISLPTVFLREWVGAGELVCLRNHLTANPFSVGCPFTNQWKVLPNPPQARLLCRLWAMVEHSTSSVRGRSRPFSVLLLQLNSPSAYLDVYSSETNEWTRRGPPEIITAQGSISFSSAAATVGELVYSVQSDSRRIITYDVQRDSWKTLDAQLPANLVFQVAKQGGSLVQTMPQIIRGCRGKVLMVGTAATPSCTAGYGVDAVSTTAGDAGEAGDGSEIINYAVVWELDWARKEWREMARAPPDMGADMVTVAMEMRKAAVMPVKYCGHAELVVAMACGAQRAVQYDVIEEKWSWLDLPPAVNCDLTLCLQPNSDVHI